MSSDLLIPAIDANGQLYPVEKLEAHQRRLRHLAVSLFVFCEDQVLLQRRALGKYHSGGLWANTCCSHPHWDEPLAKCASRRLKEELGFSVDLSPAGEFEYSADVGNGLWEHEYVHLFRGNVADKRDVRPNPAEVMDLAWVNATELRDWIERAPDQFAPWIKVYAIGRPDLFSPAE